LARLAASIGHNLRNLVRFSGRDSPGLFWPYAIAIFVLSMVASLAVTIPMMNDMFARIMDYMRRHPEGLPEPIPGQAPTLPPELMPDMSMLALPMAIVTLTAIALLASAAVRRLHDRGRTGWWAAIPLPFQAAGLAIAPAALESFGAATAGPSPLLLVSSLNSACYWIAFLALVVMLVGDGTKGPNRFGPDPKGDLAAS
jgi:uncharacterized membrane protein YhaH (DUF805 family)